jgi:hypothetical protein
VSELTYWSELVSTAPGQTDRHRVRDLFAVLVPWSRNVGRQAIESRSPESANATLFLTGCLTNLFFLTAKFGEECVMETHKIWTSLVGANDWTLEDDAETLNLLTAPEPATPHDVHANTAAVCDFLISLGTDRRNPAWLLPAKRIIVALSRSSAADAVSDSLFTAVAAGNLIPTSAAGTADASGATVSGLAVDTQLNGIAAKLPITTKMPSTTPIGGTGHVADMSKVVPILANGIPVSSAQLASVLLGDILADMDPAVVLANLPVLLHMGILHLDQIGSFLGEEHRRLLINLVRILFPGCSAEEGRMAATLLEAALEKHRFWAYEDVSPETPSIPSCQLLGDFVFDTVNLFSLVDASLLQRWGELAISWSILSPVRHFACRSLQIYRALLPPTSVGKLGELLMRLSRAIADSRTEAQGFALEVLATLEILFEAMDSDQFLEHPQFFWAAVAVLSSPHDWEFGQGLGALERILAYTDLEDEEVQDFIFQSLPTGWTGSFSGLQPLLLRGLRSPRIAARSLDVINSLLPINMDVLVDLSQGRMLFAVLANLPSLVMAINPGGAVRPSGQATGAGSLGKAADDVRKIQSRLASALRSRKQDSAAQLIESCTKPRYFRSREDFLRNLVPLLIGTHPGFVWESFIFVLSLLQIPNRHYRSAVLLVLKALVGCVNMRHFSDGLVLDHALVPLYQAAKGDCSELAIDVLNELALKDRTDSSYGAGGQFLAAADVTAGTPGADERVIRTGSMGATDLLDSDTTQPALAHLTRTNLAAVAAALAALETPADENRPAEVHPRTPILANAEIILPPDVSLVDLIAEDYRGLDFETDLPVIDSEDRLVLADELVGRHLRGGMPIRERSSTASSATSSKSNEAPSPPLFLSTSFPASVPASPGSSSSDSMMGHQKNHSQTSLDSL